MQRRLRGDSGPFVFLRYNQLIEQLIEVAKTWGVGIALAVFISWFFLRKLWPWMCAQVEAARIEQKDSQDKFLIALEKQREDTKEMLDTVRAGFEKLRDDRGRR